MIEAALRLLGWIWSHKALAALIGVAIFAAIQTSRLSTRTIERDAAQSQIEAEQEKTKTAYHQRDIWQASYEGAASALKHIRSQLDTLDEKAREQQAESDRAVADLARQRDAALSRAEAFRTELERKAHEPGATAASVGRAVLEGLR